MKALLWLAPLLLLAQRPNPGPSPRPDPAMEAELKALEPLTSGVREDDHPAVAVRDGLVWMAWVSYSETEGTTLVMARSKRGGQWSPAVQVSAMPGDYQRPAVAIEPGGAVWVAWPAQVQGNWDIYARALRGGAWSATERLTTDPGPDMAPQLAAAGNRLLLAWQGMRRDNLDILYRVRDSAWGREGFVTESPANDWAPVAVSAGGAFYVAWDSYRGDYDVLLRALTGNNWGPEIAVAHSPKLENHASLTADAAGRVWVAWETGPEKWAGDSAEGGLRPRRDIGLACLVNGRVHRLPQAEAALATLGGEKGLQAPALALSRDGGLRVFFRKPVNQNWLAAGTTTWNGRSWSAPAMIPNSEGRIDQRIVLADLGASVLAVYPAGSSHNIIYGRTYPNDGAAAATAPVESAAARPAPPPVPRHMLRGYRLVWGDLHRHTDISEDGGLPDGSLTDAMRYALDAAGLDFLGVTDHTRYLPRRYNLWRIQQVTDLFYKPGFFAPMHAYERSQYTPWGHRNIVHLNRDYVPVPGAYDIGDAGVSPAGLFAALRGKQALSIPHTSAWANKQVSWDYNDPDIERVVEIYQGLRSTYEYNGAPDPANRAVYEKDSGNFVWNALEKKIKMGFIASSDHRSTHMSFAAVYVKDIDRASVFEGLRARRTYASTDKILVDFSIGEALMGEETVVQGKPEIVVAVEGTGRLAQIDLIKNGKFVYAVKPGAVKSAFRFRDEQYAGEDAWYYVRVIQEDRNMAWASPIWVRGRR